MSLVIVDLDGTLLEGPASSEKLFFRFLLERRVFKLRQLVSYFYFFLRWSRVYKRLTPKKNKAYLAGLGIAHVERAAEEFVRSRLIGRFCCEVRQRVSSHLEHGDAVVLVTGSLDMIAGQVCSALGIRHMRATRCAVLNSSFTAEPPLVHPFGREKIRLSREIGQELGYDLSGATAYGNDKHDIELLAAVSRPVAVHPDRMLRKHALASSWEIIEHRG